VQLNGLKNESPDSSTMNPIFIRILVKVCPHLNQKRDPRSVPDISQPSTSIIPCCSAAARLADPGPFWFAPPASSFRTVASSPRSPDHPDGLRSEVSQITLLLSYIFTQIFTQMSGLSSLNSGTLFSLKISDKKPLVKKFSFR